MYWVIFNTIELPPSFKSSVILHMEKAHCRNCSFSDYSVGHQQMARHVKYCFGGGWVGGGNPYRSDEVLR